MKISLLRPVRRLRDLLSRTEPALAKTVAQINLGRCRAMAGMMFFVHAVHVLVFLFKDVPATDTLATAWRIQIIAAHGILAIITLIAVLVANWALHTENEKAAHWVAPLIGLVYVQFGAAVAVIDQQVTTEITPLIVASTGMAITLLLHPIMALVIYASGLTTFIACLPLTQHTTNILLSQRINAFSITTVALVLSIILFRYHLRTLKQQKRIEQQSAILVKTNEELKTAKEKAENATKLKDSFVSLVSHDLKGPLSTIQGFMELALERETPPEQARIYMKRTLDNASGLLAMIGELLDVSRLQSGAIPLRKRYFDLRTLAEERIERLHIPASQKRLTMKCDIRKDFRLFADRTLLGEVLTNLLSNAIKFTPVGGEVRITTEDDHTLVVSDNGTGIPDSILPDIFKHEVKTTMPGTEGEKGTGLGLPYCYDILKAHNGELQVFTSNAGTTFKAVFPEAKPRVLIVDDQAVHRHRLREEISHLSVVDFLEAENGREALDILEHDLPILVITDISMPVMDGLSLLAQIRLMHSADVLPVIVSTSDESTNSPQGRGMDSKTAAFELGANDFVMKPIIPNEFIPRVKRYLP